MDNEKIRVGICGYGNLGKGVELAIAANEDMELVAIFTRRDPSEIAKQTTAPVVPMYEYYKWEGLIDVVVMCGGSATDLPEMVPEFVQVFNTVDSFDTHARIPEYLEQVNQKAEKSGKLAIISAGWDPGMFSLNRIYAEAILPQGKTYTFWGKGVSQGHSNAIRKIDGVVNAIQYTVPNQKVMGDARMGRKVDKNKMHSRECYVAVEEGVDKERVEAEIKNMPNYFAGYETTVHFVSEETILMWQHTNMEHRGHVIRTGVTGADEGDWTSQNSHTIEYRLDLGSNPEFTASILVAYARAAYRMNKAAHCGAKTVFDVAPTWLTTRTTEELLELV